MAFCIAFGAHIAQAQRQRYQAAAKAVLGAEGGAISDVGWSKPDAGTEGGAVAQAAGQADPASEAAAGNAVDLLMPAESNDASASKEGPSRQQDAAPACDHSRGNNSTSLAGGEPAFTSANITSPIRQRAGSAASKRRPGRRQSPALQAVLRHLSDEPLLSLRLLRELKRALYHWNYRAHRRLRSGLAWKSIRRVAWLRRRQQRSSTPPA